MNLKIPTLTGDKTKQSLIYIILSIGILLLVAGSVLPRSDEVKETVQPQQTDYGATLEDRLESILSQIAGAGGVHVMVVMENDGVRAAAQDGTRTLMQGNAPFVTEEKAPEVRGVLVVAEGAASARVREALSEAVSALLGIDIHKIKVYERKETR